MTKICSSCKKTKALEDFYKDRNRKSGVTPSCVTCQKAYRNKNKKKINKRAREYYKKNKHKWKARAKKNKKKIAKYQKEYSRMWRRINKAYKKQQDKKYRENNRLRIRATKAARKRRIKKATPSWADLSGILFFYSCCPRGWHVDHIVPLNHPQISGLHILENLQYLPKTINLKKNNKTMEEFYEQSVY